MSFWFPESHLLELYLTNEIKAHLLSNLLITNTKGFGAFPRIPGLPISQLPIWRPFRFDQATSN